MIGNKIKPNEPNVVSENHLLVTKRRRKRSCLNEKRARRYRKEGRKMEKYRGRDREEKRALPGASQGSAVGPKGAGGLWVGWG